ncbi:MAG: hypothetical protein JWO31_1516 [Phycisphaerales bacterium]|nr:hypothetical protein [Phycisphaerales bacterium]
MQTAWQAGREKESGNDFRVRPGSDGVRAVPG